MSSSPSFSVAEDLEQTWNKCSSGTSGTEKLRYIQIQIKEEKLILKGTSSASASLETDFNSMKDRVTENEASYFLFNTEGKHWLFITFVPDRVAVKDKMMYSSSKGSLKTKLGYSFFDEDLHVTSVRDLSYDVYKSDKKQVDSRSSSEIAREKVLKMEDAEREERKTQIGGYHVVGIPLSTEAKNALNGLKQGTVNYVELEIDTAKNVVNATNSKTVSLSQVQQQIVSSEPRFYVYQHQSNRGGIAKQTTVFIYCCPDNAPQKLRMVYSTAKPQIADQVAQLGLELAKKRFEIREGSELTEDLLASETVKKFGSNQNFKVPSTVDGTTKAAHVPSVTAPHPVYSMLDPNNDKAKKTKKIVMPPPGAYQ